MMNLFESQICRTPTKSITLFISGIPRPKQSARFRNITKKDGSSFIGSYQSKEVKQMQITIRSIVIDQLPENFIPFTKGIEITKLHYAFPPLKSFSKKILTRITAGEQIPKTTKPDLTDNLNKGVFDALEGLVYDNDSQICAMDNLRKFYSLTPGTTITLTEKEHNL